MKQGTTFEELIARVEREATERKDFYSPANELHLVSDGSGSRLETNEGLFHVRDTAHVHLAELAGIDRRYYQKLREYSPDLLDENVNFWLSRTSDKPRVIRALDQDARAVVSPRYATLDNDALLRTVEPIITELNATVESCDINEEHLTIKLVSPRLQGEVQVNDVVQAGLIIKNSEVRSGAISIALFVKRLVCSNGLILPQSGGVGARRRHVGRSWHQDDHAGLVPESIERSAWEAQIWQGIHDDIQQAVGENAFGALLERLSATTTLRTPLEPEEVVARLGQEYKLSESLQQQVIGHLVAEEFEGSLWNVVNAVTRTAEDLDSYELATSLEELGGRLTHLRPEQWNRLFCRN